MNMRTKALGIVAGATVLAAPTAVLVAAPAHADVERHGACGGGRYELSVDRENGGFEVSLDLDGVAPQSRWRVVLKHDGKRYFKDVRRADREGDVDVERRRQDSSGKDTFRFRAERLDGSAACSAAITVK